MPLYEYECTKCHHRFEKIRKFSDRPITKCPECGGKVEQLISAAAVQFKGAGWYVTDYAKKGSSSSSESKTSADSSSKDSKDSASKESKSDSSPESKPDARSESSESKSESKSDSKKSEKKKR